MAHIIPVRGRESALSTTGSYRMQHDPEHGEAQQTQLNARREALKKMAVYGAYTAPLMVAMLSSQKAFAASGGGGGGCCWSDALLANGTRVGDAQVGDALLMMLPDGSAIYTGAVERIRPGDQPCLTFRTESGIGLTCSYSTPIPVRRAGKVVYLTARDCLVGDVLPVQDKTGFRWESLTALDERGVLPVQLLTANDGVYAAGDAPERLIFTHNIQKATVSQPFGGDEEDPAGG
jgi:hypothetical protein